MNEQLLCDTPLSLQKSQVARVVTFCAVSYSLCGLDCTLKGAIPGKAPPLLPSPGSESNGDRSPSAMPKAREGGQEQKKR